MIKKRRFEKSFSKKTFFLVIAAVLLSLLLATKAYAQQSLPIGLQRMVEYERQLSLSITFLLAFFAGLISMTSPCGIALLPTFFSVAFKDRKKAVFMTSAFSLGLLLAFTLFGLLAGFLGNFFNAYKLAFASISGILLVFFGILLFFNAGFSIFNFKLDYRRGKGFFSAALLGFFFGVGWTPCAGPILVGILLLAANASTVLNGTLMLVFYGIGTCAPLILIAYFSDKYNLSEKKFFRGKIFSFHLFGKEIITHTYNLVGGIFLIIIGILMAIFQGTFFFQTELPKYVPWSMSFWGYLNEMALESKIFTSIIGNILGMAIVLSLLAFIFWYLNKDVS